MGQAVQRTFTTAAGSSFPTFDPKTSRPRTHYKYQGVYIFTQHQAEGPDTMIWAEILSYLSRLSPLPLTLRLLPPHAQQIARRRAQCTTAALDPAPGGQPGEPPPLRDQRREPPTAAVQNMPHQLTKCHLLHDHDANNETRRSYTLPLQWTSPQGTFTWGEIIPGTTALTYLWLPDAKTHAQPPGTHLLLTLEIEAVIQDIHTTEGEDYVTANADTRVALHTKEHTTPRTAIPGSHPWHVTIVHLPAGAHTEEARQWCMIR